MRYSTLVSLAVLVGSSVVSALPRGRRDAAAAADPNDVLVLRFAEALQHLEGQFYNQSLAKFQDSDISAAGFSAPTLVVQQLASIAQDESTHAAVLDAVLGQLGSSPITGCQFDFTSALGDVATVAATARLVENVGVGAYLGAAQLLKNPSILSAAGTILTVEARHQTVLNMLSGTGTTIPSAFDLALLPTEVLAIAGPFVSQCDLGVGEPNPALAVTNQGELTPGTKLTFSAATINGTIDPNTMSCSMLVGGAGFSMVQPFNNCVVPQGLNGPVLIYVTSDDNPIAGNPSIRAQNKIVAGPTMVFIDTVPQAIPQLVRSGATSSGSSSDSSSSSSSDSATSTSSSDSSSQTASSTSSSDASSSTSS